MIINSGETSIVKLRDLGGGKNAIQVMPQFKMVIFTRIGDEKHIG